jgi:hypothetical protein
MHIQRDTTTTDYIRINTFILPLVIPLLFILFFFTLLLSSYEQATVINSLQPVTAHTTTHTAAHSNSHRSTLPTRPTTPENLTTATAAI